MTLVAGLLTALFGVGGVVLYLFGKKSVLEALLKNNEVKDRLNQLDGQIVKNDALIDAEKELLEKRKSDASREEILSTFNNLNNRR